MGSSWLPEEFDVPLTAGAGLSGGTSIDVPGQEPLDLGDLAGDPALAFRRTLGMLTTGVTLVTTRRGENVHGMPAGAFVSVPALIAAPPYRPRAPRRSARPR